MDKIKTYIVAHKIMSAIALIVLLSGGYWGYKKITSTTGEISYVLGTVTKGTIVSSVSGSGQVSASNQIDIKPNATGMLTRVDIAPGDKVTSGQLLFSIDSTNAQKAVRDAQVNLESAQLALDKIKQPADTLSLTQAQNVLDKANESKQNALDNLKKAYDDGYSEVISTYLDLPGIMSGFNDMFYKSNFSNGQWNIDWYEGQVSGTDHDKALVFKGVLNDSYNAALASYNTNFESFNGTSRNSDDATIESTIQTTYDTTKLIADAVKSGSNYVNFVNDRMAINNFTIPTIITTHKTNLSDYTSKTNTHISALASVLSTITTSKQAITDADRTITENAQSLSKLKAGADDLDIQSAELSLKQRQNALSDADDNLADYSVRAPFSGTITNVPVQKGDSVSSGTTLSTLITTQTIATISLNEVDIAKIQLGQKTTLTFDAIPDLTITGKVVQIDSIGTVSQGVVNYSVKISFDTDDARVKPGMSVSAAIITAVEQDVLTVPDSAVKNQGGSTYVEMFDTPLPAPTPGVQGSPSKVLPNQQTITTGVSDDTSTEIVSGLKEGDEIVTRTILPTAAKTTAAPSILGGAAGRTGGGAIRIPTGR